jgi:ATP-dependent RNA helicase SUPV3L1/SUV3
VQEISTKRLTESTWPIIRDYLRSVHGQAVEESQKLLQIANMTKPHTWYPLAAGIRQRVHYHAGPTNSGKTYTSIQVLPPN